MRRLVPITGGAILVISALAVIAYQTVFLSEDQPNTSAPTGNPESPSLLTENSSSFTPTVVTAWKELDDPTKDGWESEAFQESASSQLKQLANVLCANQIDRNAIEQLVVPDAVCSSLLPVGQPHYTGVVRTTGSAMEQDGLGANINKQSVTTSFHELQSRFENIQRIKFKIVSVVGKGFSKKSTQQLVSVVGASKDLTIEMHATWQIDWVNTESAKPQIASIKVEQCELSDAPTLRPFYSDRTVACLQANECFQTQLLTGFDKWLERIVAQRYFALLGTPAIAIGDVNGDGLDDLYLSQAAGLPNRLFIHQPDNTAQEVASAWEVDWLEDSRGVLLIDLDNDGDQDLVVAMVGAVVVASNEGSKFRVQTVVPVDDDTMSLSAADYDADGDLDLYTCVYDPNDSPLEPLAQSVAIGTRNFIYHDANSGGRNALLRNDIDRTEDRIRWVFENVTSETGLDNNKRFSFSSAWDDFDNDGDLDLYVANDYGRNNLYRNGMLPANSSSKTFAGFTDVASQQNVENAASGMSVAWGDYNRDGWMDIYVANMFSSAGNRIAFSEQFKPEASDRVKRRIQQFAQGNSLLKNGAGKAFQDVGKAAAVNIGWWAWTSVFADINNDGWEDIVVANGFLTTDDTSDL